MNMLEIKDIMDILHLSEKSTRALFQHPDFPSIKIGRKYLIEESVFKTWLANANTVKLDYSGV